MNDLGKLFQKFFYFLRDALVGRSMRVATKSDTVDDPLGEGWVIVLVDATVKVLPTKNPDDEPITLTLKAMQVLPLRIRRVYLTGTDDVTVYIMK